MNDQLFRVLIVEDNPGDARLIQQMLLEASADKGLPSTIEWIHKQNLRDAIACLEETQVRIVLLDLTLPDSHGTNTFQQMQQAFPLTPIIVLSGIDHEDTAVSALQHGIQEYLVKGRFDTYLLSRAIRYAIERQRLKSDLEKQHQALLDSEARRQSLMENNPDGIVIVNKDKLIRFINLPAAQILGQVKEGLVGQLLIISYKPHQIITQTFTRPDGETAVVELRTIPSEWHGGIRLYSVSARYNATKANRKNHSGTG
jgi:DNA-binding NarL/FixJ family response regulator